MTKIIDAHSHYFPKEVAQETTFFKVYWSDLDRQLKTMDSLGIEKSLLLYPTSDAHINMGGWQNVCRLYNQGIADVVQNHPDRFIGAAILPVDDEAALTSELRRIQELGFKIISLASSYDGRFLDDPFFNPILDFAQKNKILIHVHPQIINPIGEDRVRDPLLTPVIEYVTDVTMCIGKMMMEGTFQTYRDVSFLFAHYGGVLPFIKERFDNTYQMLSKREYVKDLNQLPSEYFKNLYFDTSGSSSPASLLCALELVDAEHVLFGSDFPANQNISKSIEVINQSALSDAQKNAILSSQLFNFL